MQEPPVPLLSARRAGGLTQTQPPHLSVTADAAATAATVHQRRGQRLTCTSVHHPFHYRK
ncbi:hypothetical protein JOB18_012847 [Solea senegalensis]|uniref:Uncharacterized protein n=1 Tax=Solea senegalensis TaxID=28829 RepID=A0AAV6R9B8_SOLSE|nr:hypothetical protein JOB18_012847 [Solea senegalensis]